MRVAPFNSPAKTREDRGAFAAVLFTRDDMNSIGKGYRFGNSYFCIGVAPIIDNQNVIPMNQTRLNDRPDRVGVVVIGDLKETLTHRRTLK